MKGKCGAGEKAMNALGDMEQVLAAGDPGARMVGVGLIGKVALEQRDMKEVRAQFLWRLGTG